MRTSFSTRSVALFEFASRSMRPCSVPSAETDRAVLI
jgi:hypothetical protein